MSEWRLGWRARLLLSALLPALLVIVLIEWVFLKHFNDEIERAYEERGMAAVRQIGAAAEYAIFSGSRQALAALADSIRQSDASIRSVTVLDRHGRVLVQAGPAPKQGWTAGTHLQVLRSETVTTIQAPVHAVSQVWVDERDEWQFKPPAAAATSGYILIEISRGALLERQRAIWLAALAIAVAGLALAAWLSMRWAGGVLRSLDAAQSDLRRQKEVAERLARTDPLTGLANRRAFDEAAAREVERARRHRTPLALVLADLDHFKSINDRYGHHQGDLALQHFARLVTGVVRQIDLVGRWGGEEFAILMPYTTLAEACQAAERMRLAVAEAPCPFCEGLKLSASFGVAALDEAPASLTSLLGRADAALYRAKQAGRNRVECA